MSIFSMGVHSEKDQVINLKLNLYDHYDLELDIMQVQGTAFD